MIHSAYIQVSILYSDVARGKKALFWRTCGYRYGLSCILHSNLDDNSPLFCLFETKCQTDKRRSEKGTKNETACRKAQCSELGDDDGLVLNEEYGGKQHQSRESALRQHPIYL